MILKKELMKRSIAGDTFLVPVGKTIYDSNGLFLLTEVGAFIWDLLPEVDSEAQILAAVLGEYAVDEATAAADISEFMEKLRDMQII